VETTLYFVVGPTLAVCAVLFSFLGLRSERFGSSKGSFRALVAAMAALVALTMTGAVLNGRHEHKKKAAEYKEYFAKHQDAKSRSTQGGK
jgi:hypothetical protein